MIQPFDGNVTLWTSFWDSYDSAIHQNTGLNGVDKFNYLRSLLKGSARDAISGLMLTEGNYAEAISILRRRFGNKQQIISKHMDILMNTEAVTSPHNVKALRHFHDVVESNIRSLKALGVAAETYGSLLASVLMNKLPGDLRLVIGRKIGEAEWQLDTIMTELLQEVEARERTNPLSGPSLSNQKRSGGRMPPTAATLFLGDKPNCCYCNHSHTPERCDQVSNPEERKQALMKSGRCFVCLRRGHLSRQCRSKLRCVACGGRHHSSICTKASSREKEPSGQVEAPMTALNPAAPSFQPPTTSSTLLVNARGPVLLQTARVKLFNPEYPGQTVEVRAILDTGSQQSYATSKVKDALSLRCHEKRTMSVMTFGASDKRTQTYDVVRIGVTTRDSQKQEMEFVCTPLICQPLTVQPIDLCKEKYRHLAGLDLADPNQGGNDDLVEVDLLIGSDYYWWFATGETKRGEEGPVAVRTRLGWVLSGTLSMEEGCSTAHNFLTTHCLRIEAIPSTRDPLDEILHSFWNLESLGVDTKADSVLEEFTQTVQFKDGRYEVSLPWKNSHPMLPDNYLLSRKRLGGLIKRLRHDPEVLKEYDSIIQSQRSQGIVEEVNLQEESVNGQVHFLPHHAVVRRDKSTTKVRVVYDASARSTGCSLNECLHKGPKFDQKILDILIRFRTHKIALTADVEKAFLMVSVQESDRDVLRFLWFDDVHSENCKMICLRFTRVVFGVSSSPFLLNATLRHHLDKYVTSHPETVNKLSASMYVDDVVTGAKDEEEAYQLYLESKSVLKEGGFNLRKFVTNANSLQVKIDENEGSAHSPRDDQSSVGPTDETYTKATLAPGQPVLSGEQKILGVCWNVDDDQLRFGFANIAYQARQLEPTKRNIVSIVGRFYDPLGFLSPIVIRFKILFQELCERGQDWDQPLAPDLLAKWKELIEELELCPVMSLPRCIWNGPPTEGVSCSLHGFCDASKHAYAAVVYLVLQSPVGKAVRFIASKTRVSPLKPQTIPRLELLSALLLARLMKSVATSLGSEMQLEEPTCYTDSEVSLYWIQGVDRVWKQFVQHRVVEIRDLLPSACWRHCSGVDNPADLPSRGVKPADLAKNDLWLSGPRWIGTVFDEESQFEMPAECSIELRARDRPMVLRVDATKDNTNVEELIDCQRYSSLQKLLSITGRVLEFVHRLRMKPRHTVEEDTASAELNPNQRAELLWIRAAQVQLLQDPHFEKLKGQFGLFVDEEGVWRCGGRLSKAEIPYGVKHPILLPRQHHLTTLVVRRAHLRVLHNGVKETLTEVRSKFWIVKGRAFVKKCIHQCVVCKKYEGRPLIGPTPPPLPDFRVHQEPPFTFTGVDFAGPLHVKFGSAASESKVWICLYTCCVTRAVHLEVVPDLTTAAFLRSLKRFTARRGLPRRFVSDNGKTFKAASKAIKAMMQHEDVQQYLAGVGVQWTFNLARAPWWGGVFERMIRMTKRCLKKIVGRARLTLDEFTTLITEVEGVINSRPISYVSSDDTEEPLTPAHLLCGRRLLSLPDSMCYTDSEEEYGLSQEHLTRRLVHLNKLLRDFWNRWQTEYLLELRDSHRYVGKTSDKDSVRVGDVVLVHDTEPRGFWKLARITKFVSGQDGRVRGAILKVASPGKKAHTLKRPLQRLYPLEIPNPSSDEKVEELILEPDTENQVTKVKNGTVERSVRPMRFAAKKAQDNIRAIAFHEQDSDQD